MTIHSYPKVYNLGHPELDQLLDGPVSVEEKVDGSQFNFALIDGELHCRSKGQQLYVDAPEKMFVPAVETAQRLADGGALEPGWIYRCEYLQQPKHNTIAYERVPEGYLLVFDIETEPNRFLHPYSRAWHVAEMGLEGVQILHDGPLTDASTAESMLDTESALGGTKVEGVVIKNHDRFGRDGKILAGKHVSGQFKERHGKEWKKSNPTGKDIAQHLADRYCAEGRWAKAVQHLEERGELEGSPRDIGALIKEAQADIEAECEDEVKQQLWEWARPKILRGAIRGLPEWYKQRLFGRQFDGGES